VNDQPLANLKVGGDLVESVQKIDEYEDKKRSRVSHAYRIVYRHMDK
jgi:phenylalanyl-tRNA synthetase beta subunit